MWVKCWVMYPRLIEETRSLDHAIWAHQCDPGCLHVTNVTADVCLQNYVLKFSNYCFIKFIVNFTEITQCVGRLKNETSCFFRRRLKSSAHETKPVKSLSLWPHQGAKDGAKWI